MRMKLALTLIATGAIASSSQSQARTATNPPRGGLERLPDFSCYIEASYWKAGTWFGIPSPTLAGWYEVPVPSGSTVETFKSLGLLFKFYVRNGGPVRGDLPEWSYTVTQNGVSVTSFVNSGQKPPISVDVARVAQVETFSASTKDFSPPLKSGLNKITANFMARTPSDELSKSNNGCTAVFLIDKP